MTTQILYFLWLSTFKSRVQFQLLLFFHFFLVFFCENVEQQQHTKAHRFTVDSVGCYGQVKGVVFQLCLIHEAQVSNLTRSANFHGFLAVIVRGQVSNGTFRFCNAVMPSLEITGLSPLWCKSLRELDVCHMWKDLT